MISAATVAALEERGLDYILGARERGTAVIREIVLKNERPFVPLRIPGSSPGMRGRGDTQLFVKQVTVHGARYIVCRNEAEAEKDRADRQAIVANLERRLSGGDKALVGNAGYRRYLPRTGTGKAFEIDAGKLAEEARFDGIFVLRTNATMTPLNAVLRYRELLQVEESFRITKQDLKVRPIWHWNSDRTDTRRSRRRLVNENVMIGSSSTPLSGDGTCASRSRTNPTCRRQV